jgi:hypothetical protein
MTKPTLEQVQQLLHYNPTTGILTWLPRDPVNHYIKIWNIKHAGTTAGTIGKNGYVHVSIFDRIYRGHHVCWLLHCGAWPKVIDHVNHRRSDNRILNLRTATKAVNSQNRSMNTNNTSGVNGVSWHKWNKRWVVRISLGGESKHLGYFDDLNEAVAVRLNADREYDFHPNHGVAS